MQSDRSRRRVVLIAVPVAAAAIAVALLRACHSTGPSSTVGSPIPVPARCARQQHVNDTWMTDPATKTVDDPVDCMYRDAQVIAEAGLSGTVKRSVGISGTIDGDRVDAVGPYPGLALYSIDPTVDPMAVALALINRGRLASPNYLMVSGQIIRYGPYDVPVGPNGTLSTSASLGTPNARVAVVDTGFDGTGWPLPPVPMNKNGPGDEQTGPAAYHGTFVASVVRQLAPTAPIDTYRVAAKPMQNVGLLTVLTTDDWAFSKAVAKVDGGAIVNLSFGGYGCGSDVELKTDHWDTRGKYGHRQSDMCVLIAIRNTLLKLHKDNKITHAVAAAGNDHVGDLFYPAAFTLDNCFTNLPANGKGPCLPAAGFSPWMHSVGSPGDTTSSEITTSPGRPSFSNFGPWVQYMAKGWHVLGYMPNTAKSSGPGVYHWSGTSFAAPCVAAYIAATGNLPTGELLCEPTP